MRLTPNQRDMLVHMLLRHHITFAERDDRTMVSLKKRELVVYQSRLGSYGKSHWRLTDEGLAEAKKWAAHHAMMTDDEKNAILREIMR